MEDVDILINEEAQQDMDLKTAFTPAVPRHPFFRAILGDPKQSPGGVADDQREHRTLLKWYVSHEFVAVLGALTQSCQDFPQDEILQEKKNARNSRLGQQWFRPETLSATSSLGGSLQKAYKDLSKVDLALPEGLLVGLKYAVTTPESSFRFHQAHSAAERSGVSGVHQWSVLLPTSARVSQEIYELLIGIQCCAAIDSRSGT